MTFNRVATAVSIALVLAAAPGYAQSTGDAGLSWRAGVRFGQHDFTEAEQSVDAVFGGDSASLVGAQVEAQLRSGLFLGLSYETGDLDGNRVVLGPGGVPIPVPIEETLDTDFARLTAGWMFRRDYALTPVVGAGVTSLDWSEESRLDGVVVDSVSGSETGYHALGGLRYQWPRFSLGGEVMFSSISDAVGQAGVTQEFGEDDLGGLSINVVALFHF